VTPTPDRLPLLGGRLQAMLATALGQRHKTLHDLFHGPWRAAVLRVPFEQVALPETRLVGRRTIKTGKNMDIRTDDFQAAAAPPRLANVSAEGALAAL